MTCRVLCFQMPVCKMLAPWVKGWGAVFVHICMCTSEGNRGMLFMFQCSERVVTRFRPWLGWQGLVRSHRHLFLSLTMGDDRTPFRAAIVSLIHSSLAVPKRCQLALVPDQVGGRVEAAASVGCRCSVPLSQISCHFQGWSRTGQRQWPSRSRQRPQEINLASATIWMSCLV